MVGRIMNKIDVSWSDDRYRFLSDAIKVTSSKTKFNGLRYMFNATITVGDEGFATDCKLKNRSYDLGTWQKWDWSRQAGLDSKEAVELVGYRVSPSQIQTKLKSRGINDVSIAQLEERLAKCCVETYNNGVRWEREHKLQLDFESRCNGFIAELDELKKKYALNVMVDAYVNEYDEAEFELILEDKSNLSDHVHEKYVTNELGFES